MDDDLRWEVNESLLQSYRSIFISCESFLLAVGALLYDQMLLLGFMSVIGLLIIWLFWYPVVRSRHLIVDYYKFRATLNDDGASQLCTLEQYVHRRNLRRKANQVFGLRTNWRSTRLKMDLWLPIVFSLMWLTFFVGALGILST